MNAKDRPNGLSADELGPKIDADALPFETTDDLADLTEVIGQERAVAAMELVTGIEKPGYNIFALGPAGTGKRRVVVQYFEGRARTERVPDSWCYVNNFEERHKPKAIRLPAGMAMSFRDDMDELIEGLGTALSAAFESDEYQARRRTIGAELQEKQSEMLRELQQQAESRGLALLRTPAGLVFAPSKDGEVLSPDEAQQLSAEERERLEERARDLQEDLQKVLQQMPTWQRQTQERLRQLNREIAELAVSGTIDELRQTYREHEAVVAHLDRVEEDLVANARDFLSDDDEDGNGAIAPLGVQAESPQAQLSRRYRVNVLVERPDRDGAPVVVETNPTVQNLVGRVEHRARMGALLTDFNLIKPGALHRANGGYLVLEARKVLSEPFAWDALKRALRSGEIAIESIGQRMSLVSTVSLEPEPIPLDVKVALLGEPILYYLLHQLDPDFPELFQVQADFGDRMDRDDGNQSGYARLIATMVREQDLRPFDRYAVGRLLEHSARAAGDTEKLSTLTRDLSRLLREASYWAEKDGNDVVGRADVQRAIDEAVFRADRLRERIQESIEDNVLLISTEGAQVGQVNGLAVLRLGDFSFGRPNRITARVRLGEGKLVDIEREVELGGPLHSKGVLILAGFLGSRYASEHPLSLQASLVFEQSYGGVEGDSASSAELYALLSAISEMPIRQSYAVTGSVNQHGVVQAIGGVNEKIEGFFDVCEARGLTGDQGVLIPEANVKHLVLRHDVRDAVRDGRFHVVPVATVDEGIALLTGVPAGEPDADGTYPDGTVNGAVQRRLTAFARMRRDFAREAEALS